MTDNSPAVILYDEFGNRIGVIDNPVFTKTALHDGYGNIIGTIDSPINVISIDKQITRRFDITDTIIYSGSAVPGTPTASSGWTILKTILVGGNPTATLTTAFETAVWDNRAFETYS